MSEAKGVAPPAPPLGSPAEGKAEPKNVGSKFIPTQILEDFSNTKKVIKSLGQVDVDSIVGRIFSKRKGKKGKEKGDSSSDDEF